jgi:hypothetical protein
MGILENLRAKRNFGSIQETVIHIIAPIKEFGVTSIANQDEAKSLYSILLGQRAQAAMFAGQTKGNLMLDTGIDKIYQYYQEGFGEQFLQGMKYDLPLFVFTVMYLESPNFREGMKQADIIVRREVFDKIHTVCEHFHFYLVQYPDLMCRENLRIFLSYLQKKGLT